MVIKKIDKMPPVISGDTKKDMQAMQDYLTYLREKINFALNTIEKEGDKHE